MSDNKVKTNKTENINILLNKFPSLLYIPEYQTPDTKIYDLYISPNLSADETHKLSFELVRYLSEEDFEDKYNLYLHTQNDISILFYYDIKEEILVKIIYSFSKTYNLLFQEMGLFINDLDTIKQKYQNIDKKITLDWHTINYSFLEKMLDDGWLVNFVLKNNKNVLFSRKVDTECADCNNDSIYNIQFNDKIFNICNNRECLFKIALHHGFCCFDLDTDLGIYYLPPLPLPPYFKCEDLE